MDLSLEDIIQQKRIRPGRGRGSGRGRGRGRDRIGNNLRGVRRDGIGRRASGGLPVVLPDKWQHDLFSSDRSPRNGMTFGGSGNRLHISNLDFGVNNDDVHELFLEFGTIRKATVHYDKSGRSLGTAEVIYANPLGASKAKNHYNGVPLDGRPMIIQLVGAVSEANGTFKPRVNRTRVPGNQRNFGTRGRSNIVRSRGNGRGRGRGRAQFQKPTISKEDLDEQLAVYNAQRG